MAPKPTEFNEEVNAAYPLSHGQQALWFLQQLDPASTAYNVARAVRIRTRLNVAVFHSAVQAAVDRHPALRTTFADTDTSPVQEVHAEQDACFHVEDASAWSSAQLDQRLSQETYRPFDLERGPLLRIFLFQQSDDDFVLLLVAHHIICDLWSMVLLMSEVPLLYQAALTGTPSPLRPLRTRYANFVEAQADLLAGPEGEKLWAYWRNRLADASPVLILPTDRPRPAMQTDRAAAVMHEFAADMTAQLHSLAEAHNTPLYTVALTAFQVLMHRYSGQTDILIGAPRAGRSARMAGLVGFFVNSVVHRAQLHGDPTFADLLARAHTETAADLAHGAFPFSQLVERLHPDRDLSYSPIFQVMLAWQKTTRLVSADSLVSLYIGKTGEQFEINGLLFEAMPFHPRVSVFDLGIDIVESSEGLRAVLEYNVALFDEATAVRLLSHYETLLKSIVANPQQRISQLALLAEAEQRDLAAWNNTHLPLTDLRPVHQQVEACATQTPNAIAVAQGDQVLTYRQLNDRANQLAHHLRAFNLQPQTPVGLCLPRSFNLIVGALAVLKAGGAYLALDPAYPAERLAFMLSDAQAPVLLTQAEIAQHMPNLSAQVLCLDSAEPQLAQQPITNLDTPVSPNQLAYIIYTSGSTGKPKGVMIEHLSVMSLVAHYQQAYGFTHADRASHLAAPGFDATVGEIWPTLASGASLHIPVQDVRLDPLLLRDWLLAENITIADLTTALAEGIVPLEWPPAAALRLILTGGDVLRNAPPRALPFTLLNCYGPTEATVFATAGPVIVGGSQVAPSIGRPITNTQIYVLDAALQPVPVGVPGDLYIAGLGLARGYLNQPQLTAEKFVEIRGYDAAPARAYATGDQARWLPDGNIEFLGRADNQVKIRGFRIELGEIETVLLQHPGVQDVAVVAHTLNPTDAAQRATKRLAAYVVASDPALAFEALRSHLKSKLPDYMLPAAFVSLDKLPLTPAGKLDRKALPAPEWGSDSVGAEQAGAVLPRTPTQEVLANIWRDVLRADRIGIHDSFFDLGGHSLLATQVAARIREAFHIELPLRVLFESPTLHALAVHIDEARSNPTLLATPAIVPVSRDQVLPLSFSQERMWFIHQLDPEGAAYNVADVLRITGTLNVTALQHSLNALAERHESLRTNFAEVQGQPAQVVAAQGSIPLEQLDIQDWPAAEREQMLQQRLDDESARPFDLELDRLTRVLVFTLGPQEHVILLVMHHIITDGWSGMVLAQDLEAFYNAFATGQTPTLLPLPVQYADYAHWQRHWLQGEALEAHMAYWRAQLADVAPLDLHTDHPRPAVQTYAGGLITADLDAELLAGLRRVAISEGATLFMVGLAAFQTLLHRYTAQSDIAVAVPIANRDRVQSEQLIGSLVNTLILRTDLSGNPTFRELLKRVRAISLDAYDHQNMPFAKLVAELNPTRNTAQSPLAQVMFNVINVPIPKLQLAGLTFDFGNADRHASQFDMTMTLVDTPDMQRVLVEYNTDLFEHETIQRLFCHFLSLLRLIVANPDQHVDDAAFLSEAERQHLLHACNATEAAYDREQTLPAAFADQVAHMPNAIALRFDDDALTYAELNQRANQLARHLIQKGAQPGALIGICMARSANAIIGILAALKAGCAYVPLDPAYPAERIEYMIRDAQMPLLLVDNETLAVASQHGAQVMNLDLEWDAIAQHSGESDDDLSIASKAEDTAYVIYTSGSTGKPKGVLGTHRGVLNRAHWMWRTYPFEPSEVLCQKTSLNFIDAAWEIFGPLLGGVPSVILPDATVKDPDALVRALAQHSVTRITLVPSLLKVLLEANRNLAEALPKLTLCISSGEALPLALARQFAQAMPHTRLLNLYGSSEASGDSTYYEVTAEICHATVPIGKPMHNVQTYVLDARHQLVPLGVPGELYIGGDGLARGYLNQPEMTAERFVPHPFADAPDARLYKTGDRVRQLPDGNLQYLGRGDDQIKIRGMRVATGEIETTLKQHAAVAEAVVLARESRDGELQLVAFVVPRPQVQVTLDALNTFAKARLPGHMVPRAFVTLTALPLTPNGKLDKRALPAPDDAPQRHTANSLVAPRDGVERKLLVIWQAVLDRPAISMTDDFFDLGGHSLLAVKLFAEVEKAFGVKLPLSRLFQASTLEGLAQVLRDGPIRDALSEFTPPLVPIQPNGNKPPFFCVHTVGGSVFGYAPLSRYLGDDQPFYGLEARPEEAHLPMRKRIEAIGERYMKAICALQPEGPYYLGGYSFGATLAYETARQLTTAGHTVALLAMFDQAAPKSNYYAWPLPSLRVMKAFINNLSHWLDDFKQISMRERLGRVRRKLWGYKPVQQGGAIDLKNYVDDVSLIPQEVHELMRTHLMAWEGYHPQAYPGRVTVLFTQRQPLLCSYDPHMAWDSLAQGGVDMMPVTGSHRNMLEEPHLQSLAAALKQALARAQAR